MYTAAILIASDKASQGLRADACTAVIRSFLDPCSFQIVGETVLPDDVSLISEELRRFSDVLQANLIITSGGTGFSKRDVTPEATRAVISREAPGISGAILHYSLLKTKRAMLSRGVCGIRGDSLIINLPGSPVAAAEILAEILDTLLHGLGILTGDVTECSRALHGESDN